MPVTIRLVENKDWPHKTVYPGCTKNICPYLHEHSGRRYTGFGPENEEDKVRLEGLLHTNLSENSEFWDFFSISLGEEDLILYPEMEPHDELKYIFLSGHAEGCRYERGADPTKKFVIIDEEKSAEEANKKAKLKRKIMLAVDDMTEDDVRNCLRLFGINPTGLSNNVCNFKVNEFVENQPERFNNIWLNNPQRATYILFHKAVAANLIAQAKGVYSYNSEVLGTTPEQCIAYLTDPKNLETRQGIALSLEGAQPRSKRTKEVIETK